MLYNNLFILNYMLLSVSQSLHCQTPSLWKLFILFSPYFSSWQPHSYYLKIWSREVLSNGLVRWAQRNYQASAWQCPYLMKQHTPFSAVEPTKQMIFIVVFCLWYLKFAFAFWSISLKLVIGSSHKAPLLQFEWILFGCCAVCKNFDPTCP